jgi:hypothetical protein
MVVDAMSISRHSTAFVFGRLFRRLLVTGVAGVVASCSAIQGYPPDPGNSSVVLASLQPYFQPSQADTYIRTTDPTQRRQLRDIIVLSQVRAYDIEFNDFEKSLYTYGNGLTTGSDLVLLVLAGLGATLWGASTKAALAAASAGVVGAQAAINKDLYYQKTLPALLAQMEANRSAVELRIFTGLNEEDAKYSLLLAYLDLEALKQAGGIPQAITNITQQAANANDAAQTKIQELRSLPFSNSSSSKRIRNWLYSGAKDAQGKPGLNQANVDALQQWMNNDTTDPTLKNIAVGQLVNGDNSGLEADRQRALADPKLKIP